MEINQQPNQFFRIKLFIVNSIIEIFLFIYSISLSDITKKIRFCIGPKNRAFLGERPVEHTFDYITRCDLHSKLG